MAKQTKAYLARRFVAIALGAALTGYSAWSSWHHLADVLGPLAAFSAATLLVFAEYSWRDRQRLRAGLLGVLGVLAAIISGSVVLERVSHAHEVRQQGTRSSNLPKVEAEKALDAARKSLADAEAKAKDECSRSSKGGDPRGQLCVAAEKREDAARKRVTDARSELVGLGARTAENPAAASIAAVLPISAETYQLLLPLALPLWLEIAAPAVLAYGFAPPPRKRLEARRGRRKKKRARKPATPSARVVPFKRSA